MNGALLKHELKIWLRRISLGKLQMRSIGPFLAHPRLTLCTTGSKILRTEKFAKKYYFYQQPIQNLFPQISDKLNMSHQPTRIGNSCFCFSQKSLSSPLPSLHTWADEARLYFDCSSLWWWQSLTGHSGLHKWLWLWGFCVSHMASSSWYGKCSQKIIHKQVQ